MKKLSALLLVVLVSVLLCACSNPFSGSQSQTVPEDPQPTQIIVELDHAVPFDAGLFTSLIADLKTTPTTTVTVVDARFLEDLSETVANNSYYTLELTLAGVPDQVVTIDTKPFLITRTHTAFNPISLLPERPEFTYYVGIIPPQRPSRTSATSRQLQSDGTYVYFWDNDDPIVFINIYPNRPLYYILAVVATILIGAAIYGISRYISCKKRQKNI